MGPTLRVDLGFDPGYAPENPNARPVTQLQGSHALVDTGASISCIDNQVAVSLRLPIIDRQLVSGTAGSHEVNMYLAQVFVPELRTTYYGSFAGVNLAAGGQAHVVLLGRDMLQHVRLVYDGITGQVTISVNI
ncbi:MAG: hypothetical protein K2Z80_30190 [Xanthobacteraceae bacterium]|nr:hypothetical protein [Xanthobacteraceae bacterium]